MYTGTQFLEGDIVQNSTEKYNIMVAAKECTKIDTKYAKILALTTHLSNLEGGSYVLATF